MPKRAKRTVPVSRRALIQRINRRLPEDEILKTSRGHMLRNHVGDYYILDVNRNCIVTGHVDLEKLAKELKALAPYEHLEDES